MKSFWPLVLVVAGCMPAAPVRWLREDVHPVAVHGDRRLDHVRIWTHGQMLEWGDVLVTRDSISGIPYTRAEQSDSARRAIPTALVDSLKVGYSTIAKDDSHEDTWWVPLVIACALLCPYP